MGTLRDLLILLGVFALIWLLASLFNYPEDPQLLSVEKEEKLGKAYVDLILLNPMFTELDNDRVDSAVNVIGDRLKKGLKGSDYQYSFMVFDSEMINAFTVPGGNILISSGLIEFCDSPEELAAVMAHEMGHVEERHVIFRLIKELGLDILTSGDQYVLGEVTGLLTSTSFDRKQEDAADLFASELLEDSHIEPRTLATFFRKLEGETDNELMKHFEIVSTHPNFSSRIREALSYRPGPDFEAHPLDLEWEEIKEILDNAAKIKPRRQMSVQFSGGEPTLSPHFLDAVRYSRKVGYHSVQAATNGIAFAQDPEFAKAAAEAGLRYAYLQFDGVGNAANSHRHVGNLFDVKLQAIENLHNAGVEIVPVTTLINGINNEQVGRIISASACFR